MKKRGRRHLPQHPKTVDRAGDVAAAAGGADTERLFAHGLHEDNLFHTRLSFFLLFESVLLAAVLSSDCDTPHLVIAVVGFVGFVVTGLWWYSQSEKLVLLRTLGRQARQQIPGFRRTVSAANQGRAWRRVFDANALLAHVPPALFMGIWTFLFWSLLW